MTACRNKASRAVTAALVGVLSVGAVPMVALAQTGVSDGAQLMVADDAFEQGTIELKSSKSDRTLAYDSEKNTYSVVAYKDGSALGIEFVKVTPKVGADIVLADNDDYKCELLDSEGKVVDDAAAPGEYTARVTRVADGATVSTKLVVKSASFVINDFSVYEVNPDDATDTGDTDLIYTGSALDLGVTKANLVEGEDYTYKFVKDGTDDVANAPAVEVKDAGTYWVYVEGLGQYAGQTDAKKFEVKQFDLANADIIVDDVTGSEKAPTTPDRVVIKDGQTGAGTELDPSLVKLSFTGLFEDNKAYTTFTASYDPKNTNLTGGDADGVLSNRFTVNKVGAEATFEYDGEALKDSYVVDKSAKGYMDLSKLVVTGDKEYKRGDQYTVVVRDANNKVVSDDLVFGSTPTGGTYTVTVKVDPSKTDYDFGGSRTFTVKVTNGTVDADAQVYVTYGTKTVTSVEQTYAKGMSIKASDFTVTLFDGKGNEKTEAEAGISKEIVDSDGEKVAAITGAGEYTLKITSTKYDLTGTTELPITVSKVDLSVVKVNALKSWSGSEYLPTKSSGYLWADFDLRYNTGVEDDDDTDTATDGKGWDSLSQVGAQDDSHLTFEKYDTEKGEWVEVAYPNRAKEAGDYRITVKATDDDQAKNYAWADEENHSTTVTFKVVDEGDLRFTDVTPADWFFGSVTEANDAKLMYGYSNGKVFGPNDSISRADVAVILYRMSGKRINPSLDNGYSENRGWETGYEDVNGNAYYAEAVAWARKAGIVSGYDATHFGPADSVTREQLAAMLQNYARVVSRLDVTADSSSLDKFADAGSVSSFAEGAMSWAVEKGVMGGSDTLRPTSAVSRAETAAMVVNYGAKVAK